MMEVDQENNNSTVRKSSEQRKLCYRDLLNRIEEIQESDDVGIHTINELGDILKRANLLNNECDIRERVEHADETLLDSRVLSAAGSVLVKCVDAVDIFASTYEPAAFCTRIAETIKAPENEEIEPLDLIKLIGDARTIISEVPQYSFLFGTYDATKVPEPKEKKQRKRAVQEKVAKKELLQVKNVEKEEQGTLDVVKFLHTVLEDEFKKNDNLPINYYEFVMDSSNFGSTVENIFYCAFLIRDGKAKLSVENGVPMLQPISRKDLKVFRRDDGVNTQMISSISMEDWQKSSVKEGYVQRHRKTSNKK